jgi:hypothetical protein
VALVLGVVGIVAYSVIVAVVASNSPGVTNAFALAKVEQANSQMANTSDAFPSAVTACSGQLTCVTAQDRKLGAALKTFSSTIKSISFSGSSAAAAATLVSDTSVAAQDMNLLGAATSVSQYQSIVTNTQIQQQLDSISVAYNALLTDLQAG